MIKGKRMQKKEARLGRSYWAGPLPHRGVRRAVRADLIDL
jgi:hypothetical protein